MMKGKKWKLDLGIIVPVLLFAVISVATIHSAESLLTENNFYALKQAIWYGLGTLLIIIILLLGNKTIFKYTWYLYGGCILLLISLLLFGKPINNARCWFEIPHIGVFQPSEFMKIVLILTLSKMIHSFQTKYKKPTVVQEFLFLLF